MLKPLQRILAGISFLAILHLTNISASAQMRGPLEEPYIPGQMIIQIDNQTDVADVIRRLPTEFEFGLDRQLSTHMNIYLLEFNPFKIGQMEALSMVNRQPGVTIVQNNHLVEIRAVPNDPEFGDQWHHQNTGQGGGTVGADIKSYEAWDITTGGQNALGHDILVCILEQVNFTHNDLLPNRWTNPNEIAGNGIDDDGNGYIDDIYGWDLQSNSGNLPTANSGHGTTVAGMIGAKGNNSLGVVGANWDVKMINVTGYNTSSEASVVSAYNYPLTLRKMYNASGGTQGALVVSTNASWGIDGANPNNYPIWCAFYDTLGTHGILNCGATTNSNLNVDVSGDMPTACPSQYMVGVGRSDRNDNFAGGYGLNTINFVAPGINVRSTANTNAYTTTTGTSFSSPLTAGVIALLYSIPCPSFAQIVLGNPKQGADFVFDALMQGVDQKPQLLNFFQTGGRINVKTSMDLLMNWTCSSCFAPGNLIASSVGDHNITITYDNVVDADIYTIYYQEQGAGTWSSVTTTNTTYTFNGLNACSTYNIYIESTCDIEQSLATPTLTVNTTGCGACIDLAYCEPTVTNPSVVVQVQSPAGVQTNYTGYTLTSGWGASLNNVFAHGNLVLVNSGGATPTEGCAALVNAAAVNGNIAVAVRGTCNFSLKALNAQNAGAIGLILINNQGTAPATMADGGEGPQITIPVVMVTQAQGAALLTHLQGGNSAVGFIGQQSEWIESFNFDGNLVTSGDDGGYRPAQTSLFNVTRNQSYNFTVTPGHGGQQPLQQYVRIWIDADHSGTFDAGELVFDPGTPSVGSINGSITIPGTALTGSTRMRVQMAYQGYGAGALPGTCGSFQSGEVEDYCIDIASGVICNFTAVNTINQPACATVQDGSIAVNMSGGTPGYTYSWSNGAGNVSSQTGLDAGSYNVLVTDQSGCDTSMAFTLAYTTNVQLNGSTVNHPTCATTNDGSITVNATGGTGITFLWTPNNETTASISGLDAGSYSVTATAANGCSASQNFTLNVANGPTSASFNYTTTGLTYSFINTSVNGVSYEWDFGDGSTSTQTNPIHTYTTDGNYAVCLVATGVCNNQTTCETVNAISLGAALLSQEDVYIFPNPVAAELIVQIPKEQAYRFELHNAAGQLVFTAPLTGFRTTMRLDHIATGLYTYVVLDKKGNRLYIDKLSIVR